MLDGGGKERPAGAGPEHEEQPRPLLPVHDVEVDHMGAVVALESLLDSLVGHEVRELEERPEHVVCLERQ